MEPARPPPRCTTRCPSPSSRAITRRTVRALILALRAIVAAEGQHPVPSSREHASASASSTRRSFPDPGEFAHTQFITAMLTLAAPAHPRPHESRSGRPRLRPPPRGGRRSSVSDSGSEMGKDSLRQRPSDAAGRRQLLRLTCADTSGQHGRTDARLVRDEVLSRSHRHHHERLVQCLHSHCAHPWKNSAWSHFSSHSPPSLSVHWRSPPTDPRR